MILFRTRRPGYRTLGLLLALMLVSGILSAAVPAGADGVPAAAGALLDTGTVVNAKMKTLAAGTDTQYHARTDQIKAIRMADSLPDGFAPSEANTVSAADSAYPVYIFFDNRDNAGILYSLSETYVMKLSGFISGISAEGFSTIFLALCIDSNMSFSSKERWHFPMPSQSWHIFPMHHSTSSLSCPFLHLVSGPSE